MSADCTSPGFCAVVCAGTVLGKCMKWACLKMCDPKVAQLVKSDWLVPKDLISLNVEQLCSFKIHR